MKKRILNLLIICSAAFSISILITCCIFLHGIHTAPELYSHVVDYSSNFSAFVAQDELVSQWVIFCSVIITFTCFIIVIDILSFIVLNFYSQKERTQKNILRKQKKLEELQAELDELKKE